MAALPVRMPALSATMEDAELIAWLVEVGDEVRSGQPLAEVSTDKVDMELESPHDGTVEELLVPAGSRVDLGMIIATLTSDEEDLLGDLDLAGDGGTDGPVEPPDEPPAGSAGDGATGDVPGGSVPSGDGAGVAAPPRRPAITAAPPPVRKRAKRLGVDLSAVAPTGSRGHVTHADLTRFLEEQQPPESGGEGATPPPTAAAATAPPAGRSESPARPAGRPTSAGTGDRLAQRRRAVRRATARATTRSAAIPQFTLYRRVDLSVARERRDGRSWTTEIARSLAAALWRHPECNARWDEEREEPAALPSVRIGIAVDTPAGLVVVGVDDPDADDPAASDRRVKEAIARARSGKVAVEDTQAVSSTISNLGGLGIDRFDALLVPPQPTILSVGRMVDVPVVVDGRVRVRPQIEFGLTVDHRVADGADGARLLETFAQRLES